MCLQQTIGSSRHKLLYSEAQSENDRGVERMLQLETRRQSNTNRLLEVMEPQPIYLDIFLLNRIKISIKNKWPSLARITNLAHLFGYERASPLISSGISPSNDGSQNHPDNGRRRKVSQYRKLTLISRLIGIKLLILCILHNLSNLDDESKVGEPSDWTHSCLYGGLITSFVAMYLDYDRYYAFREKMMIKRVSYC